MLSLTYHAEIRAVERTTSVVLAKDLFRKAIKALRKGKAKEYPAGGNKTALIWNKIRFIRDKDTLITLMKLS